MFASLLEKLKIKGATDNTDIGNVGDRLKVDAQISSAPGGILSWDTNVRYEDMNSGAGGIARDTAVGGTYVDIYNQTGSGFVMGYLVTLEGAFDIWDLRLSIDGDFIYEVNTKDLNDPSIYGFDKGGSDDLQTVLGFSVHNTTIRWTPPLKNPISYNSSIRLEARYTKGGSKKFRAGLIVRTI
jgi:hypothetical protein